MVYTILQQNIFRLLCIKAGKKLSQRKIATLLEVSATAVGKSIKLLEKRKMIKVTRNTEMNLGSHCTNLCVMEQKLTGPEMTAQARRLLNNKNKFCYDCQTELSNYR